MDYLFADSIRQIVEGDTSYLLEKSAMLDEICMTKGGTFVMQNDTQHEETGQMIRQVTQYAFSHGAVVTNVIDLEEGSMQSSIELLCEVPKELVKRLMDIYGDNGTIRVPSLVRV